ncbi:MAG: MarR family transcriptional regulator [Desulfobacteraceae bacterium]|nr:MarR family transcriptional regulator [Desulfobacteraceae bacterium]MBC2750542.1 MarR family transcriptional regulator [Desulfobacteraceae bacterium]
MHSTTKPLPDCTIFLLAKAYQKAHGRFKEILKPYGLTNLQHLVLEGLWYEAGQTAAELGKMLVMDKATLSGVLDRMSEAGWVEKRPDPDDRRVVRLFPTRYADDHKSELIELRKQANEALLARFSVEEQVLLKRFLWDLMEPERA